MGGILLAQLFIEVRTSAITFSFPPDQARSHAAGPIGGPADRHQLSDYFMVVRWPASGPATSLTGVWAKTRAGQLASRGSGPSARGPAVSNPDPHRALP